MQRNLDRDRTAVRAGAWYLAATAAARLISFLTTPLFTRLLTTDEYGAAGTFQSWASLLTPVFALNLMNSVGRAKIDFPGKLDRYVGAMKTLSLLAGVLLSALIVGFSGPLSSFAGLTPRELALLAALMLFTPGVTLEQAAFRYRYAYKKSILTTMFLALAPALLSLGLILLMPSDHAFLRMAGLTVPTVVLSLLFWGVSLQRGSLNCSATYWRYGLSISLPMLLHALSMSLLSQSDKLIISAWRGQTETAYYLLARSASLFLYTLMETLQQAWLPWFHDSLSENRTEEIRKNTRRMTALTCLAGLFLTALGPWVIAVLGGESYRASVSALPPLTMGVVCQCLYAHYINVELHVKKTRWASLATMAAAALNLGLNALLVPRWGFAAAAYTTLVSFLTLLVLHALIVRKKLKVRLYDDRHLFLSMGLCVVLGIGLSFGYGASLPLQLLFAALALGGAGMFFKSELMDLFRLLKNGRLT